MMIVHRMPSAPITFEGELDVLRQTDKGFAVDQPFGGWELMSYLSRLGPTAVIIVCNNPRWADLSGSTIGDGEQFDCRSDTHSENQ
jgi:hypothetical protein